MTVATSISKAGPYAGSGTTGPFTVTFRFLANSHLRVIRTATNGIDTDLVLNTDYTVSGAGDATGTVTLTSALLSGEKLTIIRNVPATQEADYVAGDAFPAETHEAALDKLTMLVQQNSEEIGRSLTLPPTVESSVSTELPPPAPNKVIGWNSTGTELVNLNAADLATQVVGASKTIDVFSGNGVTVAFTLSFDPLNINNTDVFIHGVYQQKSKYSISGTTLTFTEAPPAGSNNVEVIQAQAQTYPVTSLTDNVVTTTKITDGAVTQAKLGSGAVSTDKVADDAVTFAKIQNIATSRFLGRSADGTGDVEELTVAQVSAMLPAREPIQSISASVAGNALTISAGSLYLDFRSATLGSGTITTVSGTPANLVISSGSTLGTVSGQLSRIAVLAINNAGTIELAAVNIAGGTQLDETNLISTTAEGGAGAADSATVVYSTTARTNVAYRVIGFVESTQATAGTWATSPSKIQGSGAQSTTLIGLTTYTNSVTPIPAAGTALTGSHSLGVIPSEAVLELTCLTADLGYSVGDVVQVSSIWNGGSAIAPLTYKTTTSVGIPMPSGYLPMGTNKSTGVNANFTSANWSYRFRLRTA